MPSFAPDTEEALKAHFDCENAEDATTAFAVSVRAPCKCSLLLAITFLKRVIIGWDGKGGNMQILVDLHFFDDVAPTLMLRLSNLDEPNELFFLHEAGWPRITVQNIGMGIVGVFAAFIDLYDKVDQGSEHKMYFFDMENLLRSVSAFILGVDLSIESVESVCCMVRHSVSAYLSSPRLWNEADGSDGRAKKILPLIKWLSAILQCFWKLIGKKWEYIRYSKPTFVHFILDHVEIVFENTQKLGTVGTLELPPEHELMTEFRHKFFPNLVRFWDPKHLPWFATQSTGEKIVNMTIKAIRNYRGLMSTLVDAKSFDAGTNKFLGLLNTLVDGSENANRALNLHAVPLVELAHDLHFRACTSEAQERSAAVCELLLSFLCEVSGMVLSDKCESAKHFQAKITAIERMKGATWFYDVTTLLRQCSVVGIVSWAITSCMTEVAIPAAQLLLRLVQACRPSDGVFFLSMYPKNYQNPHQNFDVKNPVVTLIEVVRTNHQDYDAEVVKICTDAIKEFIHMVNRNLELYRQCSYQVRCCIKKLWEVVDPAEAAALWKGVDLEEEVLLWGRVDPAGEAEEAEGDGWDTTEGPPQKRHNTGPSSQASS